MTAASTAVPEMRPVAEPTITLVEGTSFAISGTTGDMLPGGVSGLYCRDTRVLATWRLLVDGCSYEPLSAHLDAPYQATFLGRRAGTGVPLLVQRVRLVGEGMREDLVLHNLGAEDTACRLTMEVVTDFADLFSVKSGQPEPLDTVTWSMQEDGVTAKAGGGDRQRGVRVWADGPTVVAPGLLAVDAIVPARGRWSATIEVLPIIGHQQAESLYPRHEPLHQTVPALRQRDWQDASPAFELPRESWTRVIDRSIQDLGALRIQGSADAGPGSAEVVAAGAPWFMTLFGRDSLLTAWMALPLGQELALSTLQALAARQGQRIDPLNEEEPGRILHEVRHGTSFPLTAGNSVYYGSVDATPLFCMLVGELYRWGMPKERLAPLMPHIDRALAWILQYGDRDGDGFVEYQRATDKGLQNQGWKDSHDSVSFADGRLADGPIALAEVQAYVYGAFLARSELAAAFGDHDAEAHWAKRARQLHAQFHEAFWLSSQGYYALALDGAKRPVDALASNMGHVLWTGLADRSVAGTVAERLISPEMFTGWGVRTLATTMRRYDPVSYHNGSVWPHDTALCAAGLASYGYVDEADILAQGILEAAVVFGGRLPELFCGFDNTEFPYPVPYPTSCSPQAWAAAAPFLLLRAVLGFEPEIPSKRVYLDPPSPTAHLAGVVLRDLPLASQRVVVDGTASGTLHGLPGIDVIRKRRR
jgi:glycogen debranching enzyme